MLYASDTWQGPEKTPPPADSSAGRTASLAAACTDARSRSDPGRGTLPAQMERLSAGTSACLLPSHHCRERWRRERKYIEELRVRTFELTNPTTHVLSLGRLFSLAAEKRHKIHS